jgi:hypothetical protein
MCTVVLEWPPLATVGAIDEGDGCIDSSTLLLATW